MNWMRSFRVTEHCPPPLVLTHTSGEVVTSAASCWALVSPPVVFGHRDRSEPTPALSSFASRRPIGCSQVPYPEPSRVYPMLESVTLAVTGVKNGVSTVPAASAALVSAYVRTDDCRPEGPFRTRPPSPRPSARSLNFVRIRCDDMSAAAVNPAQPAEPGARSRRIKAQRSPHSVTRAEIRRSAPRLRGNVVGRR